MTSDKPNSGNENSVTPDSPDNVADQADAKSSSAKLSSAKLSSAKLSSAKLSEKDQTHREPVTDDVQHQNSRRGFLLDFSNIAMLGGLAAGYGTLGYCAIRYLEPETGSENLEWQFVGTLESLESTDSLEFTATSGAKIVVARTDQSSISETGFLALSSVCPHLGCKVFWEAAQNRFFCPCHNGTFDAAGEPTGGPPADAGQSLTQYPTKIENDSLYVYAPLSNVTKQGNL